MGAVMRVKNLFIGTALAICSMPGIAAAQEVGSSVPMFRVPLGSETRVAEQMPIYVWEAKVGACSTSCGTGTRTTSYVCQDATQFDFTAGDYGLPESNAMCSAHSGPQPSSTSESCTTYVGCGYDWVTPSVQMTPVAVGTNPVGRVDCGQVREVFSPYCRRHDGVVLAPSDHAFCASDRPDYDRVAAGDPDALGYDRLVVQTGQCNASDHDWRSGGWSAWSSDCSTTASRTRSVACYRRFDNSAAADGACPAGKPAASETMARYGSCTYTWQVSNWTGWNSSCSTTAQRTRTAVCMRSNGDAVSDADCTSRGIAKPALVETTPQYGACTYSYEASAWTAWSSDCSNAATRSRTLTCKRSNGDSVNDQECSSRSVNRPATSETSARYGSCSYAWESGAWSGYSSGCSASATRTRSVVCKRSTGDVVGDVECATRAGAKPATSEVSAQYGSCSYAPANWSAWSWSSTCSSSATRTRSADCRRSDGTIVADAECSKRNVAISETVAEANYSSCSYDWVQGGWSAFNSTCSANATQTRTVTCRRSDGTDVADTECTSRDKAKPATSQSSAQYGSCSYDWAEGAWSAWSSTCSSAATQTRSVICRRSDGTSVDDAECTSRGKAKPATSQTSAQYGSCSYAWDTGGWSGFSSTCSADATQTRTVTCRRSDGANVSDAECTNRGIAKPATSQSSAQYGSCSYAWNVGGWSGYSSTCSTAASRTRAVTCRRSDGSTVADAECVSRVGAKPVTSETSSQLGSCSFAAANWTGWNWNSTCSATAQRTRTADCRRSDGAIVADAECTNRSVAVSETVQEANYSSCSYDWAQGAWSGFNSTCSANATQTRTVTCQRSDGANVGDAECINRGKAKPATSQSSAQYGSCSYGFQTGGWSGWNSSCSGSAARTRSVWCQRSDGTSVSDAECTNRGQARPADTEWSQQYGGCSYGAANWSGWSWNSSCSANAVRTRTAECRRSDGSIVASAECTNRGIGVSESVQEANYSACSYSFQAGGWSDWNSYCSGSAARTRNVACVRSDGAQVSDAECTNRGQGRPADTETSQRYEQCGYSYQVGGWSDWNSYCSSSAARTRSVVCQRSDGAGVSDAECTNRGVGRPADTEWSQRYEGCNYSAGYSGWSSCTNGAQTRTVSCVRSDGAAVDASYCGTANVQQQSCVPPTTTSREYRDYDGWSNGKSMCNQINIYNWFCDGYSVCEISSVKYITNTGAVCSVSADVTKGQYDGYRRKASTTIPDLR